MPDLRAILTRLSLSQIEAAAVLGVDARTMRRWCRPGATPPRIAVLALMALGELGPDVAASAARIIRTSAAPIPAPPYPKARRARETTPADN